MKNRVFSPFLALVLIFAVMTGCSTSKSSNKGDEDNQLLRKGYYEVYDEDDELVGYLRVTDSKLTVFDEYGNEEDSLRYDYNAKKKLYTIDDGKLFGCEEFTVEKERKVLMLITEDEDKYALEEIDNSGLPSGGRNDTSDLTMPSVDTPNETESGYTELPVGCYIAYADRSMQGYLKVDANTMTSFYSDGSIEGELLYSYDSDGNCLLEADGNTHTVQITYEQGSYYMNYLFESLRLEPISESMIPVYDDGTPSAAVPDEGVYFIGSNGSIGLYAWLPETLYDNLDIDYEYGGFATEAEYYDYDTGTNLLFMTMLASDDFLQEGIDEARENYNSVYGSTADLLFCYLRDSVLSGLDSGYFFREYLGDGLYYGVDEGDITINAQDWRYCVVYGNAGNTEAYLWLYFWMEGDNMAFVLISGIAEDSDSVYDMSDTLAEIGISLELDT